MEQVIERRQSSIELNTNKFTSKSAAVIWQQKMTRFTIEDWQINGARQFPRLAPIVIRLGIVAVQSTDLERAPKAHKVVYTSARNRLSDPVIQMLIFSYINLRL